MSITYIHQRLLKRPILKTCSLYVFGGYALVNASTTIRVVLKFSIDTHCLWTLSLTIKYFNSICLEPLEYLPFLEKKTTEVLSQYIFSGLAIESTTPRPEIKFRNHKVWLITSKHAANSASIVDKAIMDCFTLFHEIAPPAKRNTKPE